MAVTIDRSDLGQSGKRMDRDHNDWKFGRREAMTEKRDVS